MKNPKECPITSQIKYLDGKLAGIPLTMYGDKYVHDGNIGMMVYNLRKMIIKADDKLAEAKIFDNRRPFMNRLIYEAVRIDGVWVVLMNDLASYLVKDYNPKPIGQECSVERKNYQVQPKR